VSAGWKAGGTIVLFVGVFVRQCSAQNCGNSSIIWNFHRSVGHFEKTAFNSGSPKLGESQTLPYLRGEFKTLFIGVFVRQCSAQNCGNSSIIWNFHRSVSHFDKTAFNSGSPKLGESQGLGESVRLSPILGESLKLSPKTGESFGGELFDTKELWHFFACVQNSPPNQGRVWNSPLS